MDSVSVFSTPVLLTAKVCYCFRRVPDFPLIAILMCVSMVLAAGCAGTGWGEDGPASTTPEGDETGEEQEEADAQATKENSAEESMNDGGSADSTGSEGEGQSTNNANTGDGDGDGDTTEVNVEVENPTTRTVETTSAAESASSSSSSSSSTASASSSSSSVESGESETNEDEEEEEQEAGEETKTADMRVYVEDTTTGEYIEGMKITVENRETGETYTGTTVKGEKFDGKYHNFTGLPLGIYQVTAEGVGYETATNVVKLTESGRQPILHADRQYEDARVTITVLDNFGEPVTDGQVQIVPSETTSFTKGLDENGQASFRASGSETYQHYVYADGYQTGYPYGEIDPTEQTRKTVTVDRTVHELTVQTNGAAYDSNTKVMIYRHADNATTTRYTGEGHEVTFDVYTGTYTVYVWHDGERKKRTVTVTEDTRQAFAFESTSI